MKRGYLRHCLIYIVMNKTISSLSSARSMGARFGNSAPAYFLNWLSTRFWKEVKASLHDRKIGYRPDKKRVRTSHFCPCKLCGSCLLAWVRTRVFFVFFFRFGYDPKNQKNRSPYQFLDSYVSLRNNFADGTRSTACARDYTKWN